MSAVLDKLVYRYDPDNTPEGRPHIFIYFMTIRNDSLETVTLLGRRWVIQCRDRRTFITEGEGITGEKPRLHPGETFSFNSFHMLPTSGVATGSFHGVDTNGRHILVRIPPIRMNAVQPAR